MQGTRAAILALVTLAFAATTAMAEPQVPVGRRCFAITQFETWRAPDPHTMFIRVGISRVFRIDMASACQALTWPGSHLITVWRTSGFVCDAMDWDLKVSNDVGGPAMPCIVKAQTELTPQEIAQIPPRYKP